MNKSNIAAAVCALSVIGFSVWFAGFHNGIGEKPVVEEQALLPTEAWDHDHDEAGNPVYDVLRQQDTVLPMRSGYSIIVNNVPITPLTKMDDALYELIKEYYVNPEWMKEDYLSELVTIAAYSDWMAENLDADGIVADIGGQPQYRMLLGGQIASGGYVAVFICNLTNEMVQVKDAPIVGWVVLGDDATQFSYDGLHYGSTAAEVDLALGTDYELQVIDGSAQIMGRIYTYEDGSTLTCDMSGDFLMGLVYSENIFKYAKAE